MREKIRWIMSVILVLSSLSVLAAVGKKDTVMIFRPAPGLNDSTDYGELNGGMDSWCYQDYATTNYGTSAALTVTPVSNCNNTHAVGLIRFDVSALPKTVDSVVVGFTHYDHTNYCLSGCNADFYFARATERWYENTVTYNTSPARDTAFYGPINVTFPNSFGTREYNITGTYQLWRDSTVPNYGIVIYSTTSACNNAAVMFNVHTSDDAGDSVRPYLKIYYKIDTGHVDTSTAVSYVSQNVVPKLYPNPAHTEATISLPVQQAGEGWYAVMDMTGRILRKESMNWHVGENRVVMPLEGLETGMYIYVLETAQDRFTGRFLKE